MSTIYRLINFHNVSTNKRFFSFQGLLETLSKRLKDKSLVYNQYEFKDLMDIVKVDTTFDFQLILSLGIRLDRTMVRLLLVRLLQSKVRLLQSKVRLLHPKSYFATNISYFAPCCKVLLTNDF